MIRLCVIVCVAALLAGCAADLAGKNEGPHDFSGASVGLSGAVAHQ